MSRKRDPAERISSLGLVVAAATVVFAFVPVPSGAQASTADCIYSCLNAKTRGWIKDKVPGLDELSTIQSCVRGFGLDDKPPDRLELIKCLNEVFTEIPGIGEVIEAGRCVDDCIGCPDNCPDSDWTCTKPICRCGGGLWDFFLGDVAAQICCKDCVDGILQFEKCGGTGKACTAGQRCHDRGDGDPHCEDRYDACPKGPVKSQ